VTRLFHSLGYDALMLRAGTGLAARADAAFVGNLLSKQVGLFIVNCQGFVCAELTKFGLGKEAAVAA